MRIAVTGAGGLTGAEVARYLARSGHAVRAVVRRADAVVPGGAERTVADSRDPMALSDAIKGSEILVHVAGISFGASVAKAALRAGIARVVAVSSAGVYSRHRRSEKTYRRGEGSLRQAAPSVLLVRPTMIYGSERDRNVHHVLRFARRFHFLPIVGDGSALVQPIHFEDLAAAIAELATGGATGTIDAGGGASLSVRQAAHAVFAALGSPARLIRIPVPVARTLARSAELVRGGRIAERVERLLEDRTVDNGPLLALTHVRPRDFARGVADQVQRGTW